MQVATNLLWIWRRIAALLDVKVVMAVALKRIPWVEPIGTRTLPPSPEFLNSIRPNLALSPRSWITPVGSVATDTWIRNSPVVGGVAAPTTPQAGAEEDGFGNLISTTQESPEC